MGSSDAPRVHLASLGCAKNLVDSERLLGRLSTAGALVGAAADDADVIIVNTCGFIAPAIDESHAVIRDYLQRKRAAPATRLFVVGCLVERNAADLRQRFPEVDGFFGVNEQDSIAAALGLTPDKEPGRLLLTPDHTVYLRISDGCDNRCSYCTIPQIRGRFRSRPPNEILREAKQLADHGAMEINLIGQDTSLYGADRDDGVRIHDVLRRLSEIRGVEWLRLLYTHPAHFTDRLVDAYAETEKLVPYVDLPLQHVDDAILSRMGRRVSAVDCLELIDRLRDRIPGIVLRTTFIVGFPGETEAQFEALLSAVQRLRFDHLGAFAFSPEPGTPAAAMPDQIPEEIRRERVERLMLAQQEIAFARNEARVGESETVLIDGPSAEPGVWVGRTAGQAPDVDNVTLVRGRNVRASSFVRVEITGSNGYDLLAEVRDDAPLGPNRPAASSNNS